VVSADSVLSDHASTVRAVGILSAREGGHRQ